MDMYTDSLLHEASLDIIYETVLTVDELDTQRTCEIDNNDEPPSKRKRLSSAASNKENHPLRDTSGEKCKRECSQNITPDRRDGIWAAYWDMNYNERKNWLFQNVDRQSKNKSTTGEHVSRRDLTYSYKLKDHEGNRHTVCKTFFLTTLGYDKKNDKAVTTALRRPLHAVTPSGDKRGRHQPANKIDRSVIREHVESFHPCVSHYRREHAPLRQYLPSDINATSMYTDFKDKHNDFKCAYDTYRSEVRAMRISYVKLGEEGCEVCEEFNLNKLNHDHTVETDKLQLIIDSDSNEDIDCEKCSGWVQHIQSARDGRKHYQEDACADCPEDTSVRSVDLQTVIMLPRMPGMKTAIFTKRIIAFHETFASVGKRDQYKEKRDNTSVVWHEGVAGRKQEEITSTFVKALEKERDTKHVIFWLDNCAAQNKNCCLFSTLVVLVNGVSITSADINLKYFERGHTFMSADSVHHGVEKEMANRPGGNVYDFDDFVSVVSKSNSGHMDVIQPTASDFREWVGGQSVAKLRKPRPMLADVAEVQIRRGSQLLHYKTSHTEKEFKSFDFLKKTFVMEMAKPMRRGCRGISEEKKSAIVSKLCPIMPENRRAFWINLPANNTVDDLLEN